MDSALKPMGINNLMNFFKFTGVLTPEHTRVKEAGKE